MEPLDLVAGKSPLLRLRLLALERLSGRVVMVEVAQLPLPESSEIKFLSSTLPLTLTQVELAAVEAEEPALQAMSSSLVVEAPMSGASTAPTRQAVL